MPTLLPKSPLMSPPKSQPEPPLVYLALPDWQQGPISGGNRYNGDFVAALPASISWQHLDLSLPDADLSRLEPSSWLIVDTLWQQAYQRLAALAPYKAPHKAPHKAILLVHLIPEMTGDLSFADAQPWPWLPFYQHFLVTGAYARDYLLACGVASSRISLIEPRLWSRATSITIENEAKEAGRQKSRWLTVANLMPRKGQLAMLEALQAGLISQLGLEKTNHNHTLFADARSHDDGPAFCWQFYGSHDHEPTYAQACRDLVAACPLLARHVEFCPDRSIAEAEQALLKADLVLSAASCETYGMAVAEAVALDKAIIAVGRGNIPYLLGAGRGKQQLAADAADVVTKALASLRSPPPRTPSRLPAPGHSSASFAAAIQSFFAKVIL